jgi:tetratricopeptide (TPR) repeat protein
MKLLIAAMAVTVAIAQATPSLAFAAEGPSLVAVRADHSRAIDLATSGQTKSAISILERIVGQAPKGRDKDRILMTLGRTRYQDNDMQGAIDAYEQVEHRGSSWLESLEERAWAEMRLNRPQDAIAKLQTVTSPAFKDMTRTEPYFLLSLAQLRVCDYKNLFKTFEQFKKRYKDPIDSWESDKNPDNQARLKEAGETIQKLNIVEAEAIQRLYIEEDGKKHGGAPRIAKVPGQLSFPKAGDGEEVWADELEGYRVAVRGCPNVQADDTVAAQIAKQSKEK